MPHLSRKSTLRSRKCHACHAKRRGVHSTQGVRQLPPTSMKVYKVPHLSRKSTLRSRKCHACHAKRRGVHSTQGVRQLPPTSMKVYKVPHLSRKSTLRSRKVPRLSRKTPRRPFDPGRPPASADLYEGLQSATPVTQIDPEVSKVPRLSRKTPRRPFDPGRPPASADLYEGLQSATPVTQNAAASIRPRASASFCRPL